MTDFILFMHNDVPEGQRRPDGDWAAYFAKLREVGAFQGGSSIGAGVCALKSSPPGTITGHISGYIRIRAESLPLPLGLNYSGFPNSCRAVKLRFPSHSNYPELPDSWPG